jgi:tripartite ATP-independent transporter DctP family solute receptor
MTLRGFMHLTAGVLAGALMTVPAQAETLRIGSPGNPDFAFAKAIDTVFVPEVAKATQGRHTVQTFWGGQLGGLQESVSQTRNGAMFGTSAATSYFTGFVPELNALNLPFLFDSREQAFKVLDGPIGKELAAKLEEKGFVLLGFFELGFRNITSASKPIATPADLKGMKIRVQPNPLYMDMFKMLGANPVQMDIKDLFSALRQGVVDGHENPFVFINMLKLHEANQKFVTDTGHVYEVMLFVGSKKMMDAMTPADREAIRKAGSAAALRQREISAELDKGGREAVVKQGYTLTTLTAAQRQAFRDATRPMYQQIEKDVGGDLVPRLLKARN